MDLSDPSRWHTWSGRPMVGDGTGVPALPCLLNSGDGAWQRHVTHTSYATAVTLSGWFEWEHNTDPNFKHAGIHIGLTQDNDHGYHFSVKAGVASLLVEYGGTYSRLTSDKFVNASPGDGVRHQFWVRFGTSLNVASIDDVVLTEDAGAHHRFPRLPSGRLGLRLDRQRVKLGALVTKE